MNTRVGKYGLLFLALIVWSWLGVRIYQAFNAGVVVSKKTAIIEEEQSELNTKTSEIVVDYKDPFYYPPSPYRKKKVSPKPKKVVKKPVKVQKWPKLAYKGMMGSKSNKVLFIEVNEQIVLLKKPYLLDSLKFNDPTNSSVHIILNNDRMTLDVE